MCTCNRLFDKKKKTTLFSLCSPLVLVSNAKCSQCTGSHSLRKLAFFLSSELKTMRSEQLKTSCTGQVNSRFTILTHLTLKIQHILLNKNWKVIIELVMFQHQSLTASVISCSQAWQTGLPSVKPRVNTLTVKLTWIPKYLIFVP